MRLLDLFCGRWGLGKQFAARGHEVIGVDIVEPPETPSGCRFIQCDVLLLKAKSGHIWIPGYGLIHFDFGWASSPCENFSLFGMRLFHPNPPYPELGINLFNHTRGLFDTAGAPYVMENVRAAQQFVGKAVHHCGPFYLWGTAVPPLLNQGITKGAKFGAWTREQRKANKEGYYSTGSRSKGRAEIKAKMATIPPELANCVADYAERLLEAKPLLERAQ